MTDLDVADVIRALTAELATDPSSLVFLELAELLRRRRQLDAALKVARAGAGRYPDLADARDLCARIHSDAGDGESAFDAWMEALRLDPTHLGAHKGLGFLYYRAGDHRRALRHLEIAVTRTDEPGLHAAIARVRTEMERSRDADRPSSPLQAQEGVPFVLDGPDTVDATAAEPEVFHGLGASQQGLLLLDANGMRLGGGLRNRDNVDVSDAAAAHMAGVSREAARAARLLELGSWLSVTAECPDGNLHLSAPSAESVLLTVRDASIPAARLALLAERAGDAARRWLERPV